MGFVHESSRAALTAVVGVIAALALLIAPSARSVQLPPAVDLGPITVANGSAALTGTIGGASAASTDLMVNGQPLAVDSAGHFAGTVSLNGESAVSLSLRDPLTGQTTAYRIPVDLGGALGVIPSGVTSTVDQALASVLAPAGGFKILDGLPLTIGGHVVNGSDLASMQVNGTDVLPLLNPDGTFTLQLPGTTKEITITTTDKQGTSATSTYGVQQFFSTPGSSALSVSAATAVGLKIAGIRYFTKGVAKTHRLRMVVTVKDSLGHLVRGAGVQIRSAKAGRTVRRQQAKKSSNVGKAAFTLRVRNRALGKRLVIVTTAKTPTAKAKKTSSVRVPRAKRLAKHHR
jgi:hypothetical protein